MNYIDGGPVPRGGPELDGLTYFERKVRNSIAVSSLPPDEWERCLDKMCENMGKAMSDFYSGIGWELFVQHFLTEKEGSDHAEG